MNLFGLKSDPAPTLSRDEALNGIPHLAPGVQLEKNPNGEDVLIIQRRNFFMKGLLNRFGVTELAPKQVILDELGLFVVELIDGKRPVNKMVKLFSKQYKIHPLESEKSVTAFLSELVKRNAIFIAIH